MKTKYLLGALTFPFVMAACTNDDFEVVNNGGGQNLEGDMIELPDNFALVGTRAAGADTRAGFINERLGWCPVGDKALDVATILNECNWDRIGLAWLNAAGAQDGRVYTNYTFRHYGWLNKGAREANYDKCNDNVLTNGVWFTGDATQENQFKKWNGSAKVNVTDFWDNTNDAYQFESTNFSGAGVDANRGLFRTDCGTIFGGEYLVYYPFNEELKDIDHLSAISTTEFTNKNNISTDETKYEDGKGDYKTNLAPEYFMVGRTSVNGGVQAAEFTLGQLSGMIALKVQNNTDSKIENITKAVIYAKEGKFYTSVKLDATKIVNSESAALGEQLYYNEEQAETAVTLISEASNTTEGITIGKEEYTVFGFAALPTTISKYLVIIQDKEGNTYAEDITTPLTVKPLAWNGITISAKAPNAKELYAYDEASFKQAIKKAEATARIDNPVKIYLLGTVTLTESINIPAYVTVEAMTKDDKLVVSRHETTAVNLFVMKDATLDCSVDIQGQGCCGLKPGTMIMNGDLEADRVINNFGSTITFGEYADENRMVKSEIDGEINNVKDPENEACVLGSITIRPYTTVSLNGTLVNDGNVTIETSGTGNTGTDGTLNIYPTGKLNNNNAVTLYGNLATNGKGQFNNNKTFTVKVSAQITSKGVTNQPDEAEYICEVNSDVRYADAINNASDAIHYTTLVRFVDGNNFASDGVVTYAIEPNTTDGKITNKKNKVIDFESKISSEKVLALTGVDVEVSEGETTHKATTIGKLTIVGGGFVMNHKTLTVAELNVAYAEAAKRWFQVNEKLNVSGDVNISNFEKTSGKEDLAFNKGIAVGGNMTVDKTHGENILFAKGTESEIKGYMDVNTDAKMKFEANSVTTIRGEKGFMNDGQVDIVPATKVDDGDVAARVICKTFTNFGDRNKWLNDSYPQDIL